MPKIKMVSLVVSVLPPTLTVPPVTVLDVLPVKPVSISKETLLVVSVLMLTVKLVLLLLLLVPYVTPVLLYKLINLV